MATTLDEALQKLRDGPEITGLRLLGTGSGGRGEDSRQPPGQEDSFLVATLKSPLTVSDLEKLVEAVSATPRLTTFELVNQSEISEEGWSVLGKIFTDNLPLQSVALRKCNITDQVYNLLTAPLAKTTHLKELDLSGNSLKLSPQRDPFGKHFCSSSTFETLNVSHNEIIYGTMMGFTDDMATSPTEKKLIIAANPVVGHSATMVEKFKREMGDRHFCKERGMRMHPATISMQTQLAAGLVLSSKLKAHAPNWDSPEPTGDDSEEYLKTVSEMVKEYEATKPSPAPPQRPPLTRLEVKGPEPAIHAPTLLNRTASSAMRRAEAFCHQEELKVRGSAFAEKARRPGVTFLEEPQVHVLPFSPTAEACPGLGPVGSFVSPGPMEERRSLLPVGPQDFSEESSVPPPVGPVLPPVGQEFSTDKRRSLLPVAPEFSLTVEPLGSSRLLVGLKCSEGVTWTPFKGSVEVPCCMSMGQIRQTLASYVEQRPCFRRTDVKFLLPCGKVL